LRVEADTCCAPGFVSVTLRNSSSRAPAFIFIADETPLHRKLGRVREPWLTFIFQED